MAACSCAAVVFCGAAGSCAAAAAATKTTHRTDTRLRAEKAEGAIVLAGYDFALLGLVQLERELQIPCFVAWERHRIHTGVARGAVGRARAVDGAEQAAEAQVLNAVGFDEIANLVEGMGGRDQLVAARRFNA